MSTTPLSKRHLASEPLPPSAVKGDWMAAIVEGGADPTFSYDLEGRIVTWNKSAELLLGYKAAEIIGQSVIGSVVPLEKADEQRAFLAWLARGQRIEEFETLRRHKNGQSLPVSVCISPLFIDGVVVGAASVVRSRVQETARRNNVHGAVQDLESHLKRLPDNGRQPLKALGQFVQLVLENYAAGSPVEGKALMERAAEATQRVVAHIEKHTK